MEFIDVLIKMEIDPQETIRRFLRSICSDSVMKPLTRI